MPVLNTSALGIVRCLRCHGSHVHNLHHVCGLTLPQERIAFGVQRVGGALLTRGARMLVEARCCACVGHRCCCLVP